MQIIVVTGLSGSGKSAALNALEDLGYYSVDNLPLPLLPQFVDLINRTQETHRAALVVDARSGEFIRNHESYFSQIRRAGHEITILFLSAPEETLVRRFSETRRRHPLAKDDLHAGILAERKLLEDLHDQSDDVIDTGNLTTHDLKRIIWERYGSGSGEMSLTLVSFGFKRGLPQEADLVLDVRFLPNPYFVEELNPLPGTDSRVASFVLEREEGRGFMKKAVDLLSFLVPRYVKEGKTYLTVATGCTGGRHRSVAVTERLKEELAERGISASVRHRDIEKQ